MSSLTAEIFNGVNSTLEVIKWPLAVIIISLITRKPLTMVMDKIKTLRVNNGNTSLEATIDAIAQPTSRKDESSKESLDLDVKQKSDNSKQIENKQLQHWMLRVDNLIDENDIRSAREIFEDAMRGEKDPNIIYNDRSFFSLPNL